MYIANSEFRRIVYLLKIYKNNNIVCIEVKYKN